jgi:hypothetical protein
MPTKQMTPRVNVEQPYLFDDLDTPEYKQFLQYHEANPQIYQFIRRYALRAIERKHTTLSIEFLTCIIRWETSIGAGDDEFKINNNFRPFYARMFMREFPAYKDFFRTRRSKADKI